MEDYILIDNKPTAPYWTLPLSRRATTALLTVLAALGALATSTYVPSLPDLASSLHTSPSLVQMTMTAFMLGFAVMQLVYGPLSDSKGRRLTLLLGLSIFLLGNVLCATASTIKQLIFSRTIQALGACVGPAVARAVVRDVFGAADVAAVMASVAAGISLAPAIGPTLGGFLHSAFSWHASFIVLTALSFALLFTIWRFLPETNQQKTPHTFNLSGLYNAYKELFKNKLFMAYNFIIAFSFGGMIAYVTGAPFLFIKHFGVSPANFGLLTVFNALGFLCGTLINRRRVGLWSNERLARLGSMIGTLGGGWLLIQASTDLLSIGGVLSGVFVFQLGLGIQLPASFTGSVGAAPHLAGTGSGLVGFCQMGISALLSYLVALLYRTGYVSLMSIVFLALLTSFFVSLALKRKPSV